MTLQGNREYAPTASAYYWASLIARSSGWSGEYANRLARLYVLTFLDDVRNLPPSLKMLTPEQSNTRSGTHSAYAHNRFCHNA